MDRDYEKEAKELPIYYIHYAEEIKGFLCGMSAKEVVETYQKIKKCTCGGNPIAKQIEGMGIFDFIIECEECGRSIWRNEYDFDVDAEQSEIDLCIQDWNDGLTSADIQAKRDAEHERIRLKNEDLIWYPLYPNNMEENGLSGYYAIVLKRDENRIYACKWTITFQHEEIRPNCISSDSKVEAYILFMKRYFDVKGALHYPEPSQEDVLEESEDTFTACGVNEYGDFVRAYSSLEAAKEGAVARCGWQGLTQDTILRVND